MTMKTEPGRYVLIGLGGTGSWTLRLLLPYLDSTEPGARVVLVDGDDFVEANRSRMAFRRPGPKAQVLAEELAETYGERTNLVPEPRYINSRNARELIGEGDVVFCLPDNHATRRVVERRCMKLRNVALFSGGNEGAGDPSSGTSGNVQVYVRVDGEERTNRLSAFHPEIAQPEDHLPNARGCAEAASSQPQLIFTNAAVSSALLGAFYAWRLGTLEYEEIHFDIAAGRMVPVQRKIARPRGKSRRRRPSAPALRP
jgi:hypothetical protein